MTTTTILVAFVRPGHLVVGVFTLHETTRNAMIGQTIPLGVSKNMNRFLLRIMLDSTTTNTSALYLVLQNVWLDLFVNIS